MDDHYSAVHAERDRNHWWFRGRLQVLLGVLERSIPCRPARILELGCGTGNVMSALSGLGQVVGMEVREEFVSKACATGLDVRRGVLPGDLVVPPGWADVVLMLDVLEHLDDDVAALKTAAKALREGGMLVATVPAYGWLWSAHDVVLGHHRRYSAGTLAAAVLRAGFAVDRVSYFNTLLFPALAAVRAWKRLRQNTDHDLHAPPETVNNILAAIFALERFAIARCSLPFGASVLLLGSKSTAPAERQAVEVAVSR